MTPTIKWTELDRIADLRCYESWRQFRMTINNIVIFMQRSVEYMFRRLMCLLNHSIACLVLLFVSIAPMPSLSDELTDAMALWRKNALWCDGWGGDRFPTMLLNRSDDDPDPSCRNAMRCQDGDSTMLPNALLCAVGEEAGCKAVEDAFDDATGQWYRSPRLKALRSNPLCETRDESGKQQGNFSPDMALGVQLYLITKHDESARRMAEKWFKYLDQQTSELDIEAICPKKIDEFKEEYPEWTIISLLAMLKNMSWPAFCKEQSECGCFMRPNDIAVLFETEKAFQLGILTEDSILRGFIGTLGNMAPMLIKTAALTNKPGFSRHLVGVSIMILKKMSHLSDGDRRIIDSAADDLAAAEPDNPFYAWLARKPVGTIRQLTLAHCPTLEEDIVRQVQDYHGPRTSGSSWWTSCSNFPDKKRGEDSGELGPHDYFLQREMSKRPWCETSLWDCIVASKLAGAN